LPRGGTALSSFKGVSMISHQKSPSFSPALHLISLNLTVKNDPACCWRQVAFLGCRCRCESPATL
jgi:hypothetical protein